MHQNTCGLYCVLSEVRESEIKKGSKSKLKRFKKLALKGAKSLFKKRTWRKLLACAPCRDAIGGYCLGGDAAGNNGKGPGAKSNRKVSVLIL